MTENENINNTLPTEEQENETLFEVEVADTPKKKSNSHKGYSNDPNRKLTQKEILFANSYLETSNGLQSAIKAGYAEKFADVTASKLLKKASVARYIQQQRDKMSREAIATAQDVMEYLTRVMKGEEKDQFGLDASLAERTKAAIELAKRTVDLENRLKGQPDNVLQIQIDWGRDNETE